MNANRWAVLAIWAVAASITGVGLLFGKQGVNAVLMTIVGAIAAGAWVWISVEMWRGDL